MAAEDGRCVGCVVAVAVVQREDRKGPTFFPAEARRRLVKVDQIEARLGDAAHDAFQELGRHLKVPVRGEGRLSFRSDAMQKKDDPARPGPQRREAEQLRQVEQADPE
jgi:hypothetical protein